MQDNTHGYTDFHSSTPSVDTGLTTPEVVKESYVVDYTTATRETLTMHEDGGFDYRWVYGLDKLSVKITSEGTNWWGQNVQTDILKDYAHQDRMGSTTNLTDQFGRVVGRADYDEWGEITYKEALSITSAYRRIYPQLSYTGHDWDDVLGMYYAKARFYDPAAKRFVAMDPVKGNVAEPLSLVPYIYCVDNPLRWVDPLGTEPITLALVGLAALTSLVLAIPLADMTVKMAESLQRGINELGQEISSWSYTTKTAPVVYQAPTNNGYVSTDAIRIRPAPATTSGKSVTSTANSANTFAAGASAAASVSVAIVGTGAVAAGASAAASKVVATNTAKNAVPQAVAAGASVAASKVVAANTAKNAVPQSVFPAMNVSSVPLPEPVTSPYEYIPVPGEHLGLLLPFPLESNSFFDNIFCAKNNNFNDDESNVTRIGRSKGQAPRNNNNQNKQFAEIVRRLALTLEEARRLHDEITGQGYSFQEILEYAKDMFNKW